MIEHRELTASLQLLVLSVVVLPYLPNAGLGPYGALNPYQLWWAVILIAGLSLAVSFLLGCVLVPRLGALGAAVASSTGYIVAIVVAYGVFLRQAGLPVKALWRPSLTIDP